MSARADRHARRQGVGSLVSAWGTIAAVLVSAFVAYQGVQAWREQTAQSREAAEEKAARQATLIGAWWEQAGEASPEYPFFQNIGRRDGDVLVMVNRSLDPVKGANLYGGYWRGWSIETGDEYDGQFKIHMGTFPPCARWEIRGIPLHEILDSKDSSHRNNGPVSERSVRSLIVGLAFVDARNQWWMSLIESYAEGGPLMKFEDWPGIGIDSPSVAYHLGELGITVTRSVVENCGNE